MAQQKDKVLAAFEEGKPQTYREVYAKLPGLPKASIRRACQELANEGKLRQNRTDKHWTRLKQTPQLNPPITAGQPVVINKRGQLRPANYNKPRVYKKPNHDFARLQEEAPRKTMQQIQEELARKDAAALREWRKN